MAKKPKHNLVTRRRSAEEVRQDLERRRSSAADRHVPATRKGSRASRKAAAIKASQW